jgi:hypothetical protein
VRAELKLHVPEEAILEIRIAITVREAERLLKEVRAAQYTGVMNALASVLSASINEATQTFAASTDVSPS